MKMRMWCMMLVVVMVAVLTIGCQGVSDKVKTAVVALDQVAENNEVIVEKLCVDASQVTEAEKIEAIRNARIIHMATNELRKLVVDDD